ncbi:MAG: alpha-amylase/4-alpha-glucanotransferase domain-containing protein, partial [Bacteroidota bacterium]
TLLDDYHFNGAGWLNDKLHGYFITEHEGYKLKILPIMESLRYTMPALKPPDVIDYIKKTGMDAGGGMRIAMGDIEKFGVWPKSYKIIYEDGWLHAFFQELSERQKKSDVMTIKFSDYIKQFPSDGNIYIPSGSYSEMGRWSMPYESGTQFWPVLDEVKNTAPDRKSPWMHFVRGGFFRNMLVKYPESNSMHKKMLKLSRDIKEFEEHPDFQKMQKHLFRGQCNCAYWHGVFGGVYIKHLRQALFHELLQCEKLLHQAQGGGISICQDDTIFYGQNEIQATSDRYSIHLHPVIGANVSEFSEFRTCHNMGFVMRRRREVYHNVVSETTLTKEDKSPSREDSKIPEKQAIIDWYDRSSFIMHFFHPDTKINDLKKCTYGEQGDFINQEFDLTVDSDKKKITCVRNGHVWQREGALGIRVTKIFEFPESDEFVFKWTIENTSDTIAHLVPGIEMNILPSNEQTSKFRIAEKEVSCSGLFEGKGNEVILDDKEYNLKMKYSCGEEYRIWSFPVNSVCRFETGFTDVFQGVSLTFLKTVNLKPGAGVSGIMKIIAE